MRSEFHQLYKAHKEDPLSSDSDRLIFPPSPAGICAKPLDMIVKYCAQRVTTAIANLVTQSQEKTCQMDDMEMHFWINRVCDQIAPVQNRQTT